MNQRLQAFESYKSHGWLQKSFKKLKVAEIKFCRELLNKHENTSKDEFALLVVRLFLDTQTKPKNWVQIEELLICANSTIAS